jgi:hypothetical protein
MRTLLSWEAFDPDHGWTVDAVASSQSRVTTLLGPQTSVPESFTEVIPSWCAETPAGSWIEVQLRVRCTNHWTKFYRIAQWDSLSEGSVRQSFDIQADDNGQMMTDTLVLNGEANMVQPRVLLYSTAETQPSVKAVQLALSRPSDQVVKSTRFRPIELPVPFRSQMIYTYGGNHWCSPTSVTMVLAYWYTRTGNKQLAPFLNHSAVPDLVVPQVYDPIYDGHGNWAFNTAFAASYGLCAYVTRLAGMEQIEPWIATGVPVIIGIAWTQGTLLHAPLPSSSGHLLVVIGFDERGQIITADPAGASESEVRRIYDILQLESAWQQSSVGVAYLIYPHDWPTPPPYNRPWR